MEVFDGFIATGAAARIHNIGLMLSLATVLAIAGLILKRAIYTLSSGKDTVDDVFKVMFYLGLWVIVTLVFITII